MQKTGNMARLSRMPQVSIFLQVLSHFILTHDGQTQVTNSQISAS